MLKPSPAWSPAVVPGTAVPAAPAAPMRVLAAAASPCGRFVALGCTDKIVRVWHIPRDVGAAEPRQGAQMLAEFEHHSSSNRAVGSSNWVKARDREGARLPREVAQ